MELYEEHEVMSKSRIVVGSKEKRNCITRFAGVMISEGATHTSFFSRSSSLLLHGGAMFVDDAKRCLH